MSRAAPSPRARAVVDLSALRANLRLARARAPDSRVMAVVKANAYGHGLLEVAHAFAEADALAVACTEEALALRAGGVSGRVVLLEGVVEAAELELAARHDLDIVVHHEVQLGLLESARALPAPLRVWVKLDTGMHRLGFAPGAARAIYERLSTSRAVGALGWMTHFACADDRGSDATARQLAVFDAALEGLPGARSAANSGALLGWPQARLDWVRPGILLYGVSPYPGRTGADEGLAPVMALETRLIAVNAHRRGDAIGYGGTWVCPEDMAVGVAAIGYGDGYPRHAVSGTPVLVGGARAALIGRVSMDMITLDLRGQPRARPGDPVTLWGPGLAVEEVADHAGTIAYELLCTVGPRVARLTRDDGP